MPPQSKVELYAAIRRDARAGLSGRALERKHGVGYRTMPRYLLSVRSVAGEVGDPMTDEEVQQSWKQIQALNEEMKSAGAWVFSGALHEPDTATVVRMSGGEVLTTDGPFAESKEHIGGFYIIQAEDLDAALAWASKATAAVRKPIEVSPFRASEA